MDIKWFHRPTSCLQAMYMGQPKGHICGSMMLMRIILFYYWNVYIIYIVWHHSSAVNTRNYKSRIMLSLHVYVLHHSRSHMNVWFWTCRMAAETEWTQLNNKHDNKVQSHWVTSQLDSRRLWTRSIHIAHGSAWEPISDSLHVLSQTSWGYCSF